MLGIVVKAIEQNNQKVEVLRLKGGQYVVRCCQIGAAPLIERYEDYAAACLMFDRWARFMRQTAVGGV